MRVAGRGGAEGRWGGGEGVTEFPPLGGNTHAVDGVLARGIHIPVQLGSSLIRSSFIPSASITNIY